MGKVVNINMYRKLSDLFDNEWKFTIEEEKMADNIHYQPEREEWISACGKKSTLHKPLRITPIVEKVTCPKCLEYIKTNNGEV